VVYPIIDKVLYIPTGAGFRPSTVPPETKRRKHQPKAPIFGWKAVAFSGGLHAPAGASGTWATWAQEWQKELLGKPRLSRKPENTQ